MINFTHLHLHTEFSIKDSIIRIPDLMQNLKKQGAKAVAITDLNNLFGLVKFYKAAIENNMKPIIGAEIYCQDTDSEEYFHLVLLCQNEIGYKNLTQLISKAYIQGQVQGIPRLKKAWLESLNEGLIALSAFNLGDVGRAIINKDLTKAKKLAKYWKNLFSNRYYLEIQRIGLQNEHELIEKTLKIGESLAIPVVATNAVCFEAADDFEAHEARVCIHGGWVLEEHNRLRNYTEQQYLRSGSEMQALFADIPAVLENTNEVVKRCNMKLSLGKTFLPNFPIPKNIQLENFFRQEAQTGLQSILKTFSEEKLAACAEKYQKRLDFELEIIIKMGFPGYFLIVADFIIWAKQNNIPVGPGRGSGAGSLVAYALGITGLDPIEYDLLFERFLNPERVSMPDFDIDFCMEGRDRVIEYVASKYGRLNVSQIITFGTMAAKAVVRDVGRVMGFPYGFVDKIAKLIPFELGITLKKALQDEARLLERYQNEEEVKNLIDMAIKLEGIARNAGKHAGGVVIAPTQLTDFTPLYCEADSENIVSQFDKDDVEAVGLVKFDFLGLRTLTIINWTLENIKKTNPEFIKTFDIEKLATDDKKTFDLLKTCATTAVFQLESRGMKDLIKRLQPDCFDDIVALVALFRPGPLQSGMVDDFINRKHGKQTVTYLHPILEPILKSTYGVILYQEQVMQIAQDLAGYTLGAADLLRRAMSKKKTEEMAKHRSIFVSGAESKGVNARLANNIYDLMEKFVSYGFNKSHSVAYAMIAYQTAWLKTHFPAEFIAAVLSSDMDNTDKIVRFLNDAKLMALKVLPPDINTGQYQFTVKDKQIIYGLGAIKGVGQAAIESILQSRLSGGYKNLFDFCHRVDTRKVNRKVLEALIFSGAMDSFHMPREVLLASIDLALQAAEQHQQNQTLGQHDLFGHHADDNLHQPDYTAAETWPKSTLLANEKATLGFYLSGHPIEAFNKDLQYITTCKLDKIQHQKQGKVMIAGFINSIRTVNTKRGGKIAFITIEDDVDQTEVTVFPDIYAAKQDLLQKDQLIIIEGEIALDDYTGANKINANDIFTFEATQNRFAKAIVLTYATQDISNAALAQILKQHLGGKISVFIKYFNGEQMAQLKLGEKWLIQLNSELFTKLQALSGVENLEVVY